MGYVVIPDVISDLVAPPVEVVLDALVTFPRRSFVAVDYPISSKIELTRSDRDGQLWPPMRTGDKK